MKETGQCEPSRAGGKVRARDRVLPPPVSSLVPRLPGVNQTRGLRSGEALWPRHSRTRI